MKHASLEYMYSNIKLQISFFLLTSTEKSPLLCTTHVHTPPCKCSVGGLNAKDGSPCNIWEFLRQCIDGAIVRPLWALRDAGFGAA